jgi:hypothetical protein
MPSIGGAALAPSLSISQQIWRARGCEWLHVDYEPRLAAFYQQAGFIASAAGVMHLDRTG